MDTARLRELVPHYLAMFLLVLIVLEALRSSVDEMAFYVELLILVFVCLVYMMFTIVVGIAPSSWDRNSNSTDE